MTCLLSAQTAINLQFEDQYLSSVRERLVESVSTMWGQIRCAVRKKKRIQARLDLYALVSGCMSGPFWFAQSEALHRGKIQPMEGNVIALGSHTSAGQSSNAAYATIEYSGPGTGCDGALKVTILHCKPLQIGSWLALCHHYGSLMLLLLLSHTCCRALYRM